VLPEVAATDLVGQSAPHDLDVLQHTRRVLNHAAWLRDWLLGRRPRTPLDAQSLHYLEQATRVMEPWLFYLRQHFAGSVASGHTRAEWLVWHALFHDVGKPDTRTVEVDREGAERVRFFGHERLGAERTRARLEALRFSRVESDLSAAVVEGHMRPHSLHDAFAGEEISRRARFRFFRDVGVRDLERPAGVDVLMLATADLLGTNEQLSQEEWRSWLLHIAQMLTFLYSERGYSEPSLQPLLDGHMLQRELGLEPGPQLGRILDQLLEAHAAGEIRSRDEALALAARLVQQDDSV
jgi:putative nucleotidyltransferase with HDIG domain